METLPNTLLLKDITIIPELDSFLPELDAEELGNLEKDIKAEGGVRDPLVIWVATIDGEEKNVLVDGHNRCRIVDQLKKTKTPLSVTYVKLKDMEAAKEWMLNNQLSRRNLDVFTRVQLVLKLEGEIRQRAAERKKKGQFGTDASDSKISDAPEETGTVLEILGKKAKTSKDTVLKIKKILTGIPRLRDLVDTEQLSINQAAEIVNRYQPEEQDAAINRVLTLGRSDQLEEVDAREPRIKGSTGKTFKLKNSYIQFVEKADGKPDTSNFLIGDAFFQGVCVRSYGGGMQLVQSQYFLNVFSDEKPLMYDEAMSYLKEVQGYITIAHDLINSGKAVEKAEKKVKKAKATKQEKAAATIDQPTKAVKAKSGKAEAPKFTLTDEDKTAILEYYRNDHLAEHSIKSIEEYGFDPEKVFIEKGSIGEALRLKRANPDAVLPEIEWKKMKTASKKAPTTKKSVKASKSPKNISKSEEVTPTELAVPLTPDEIEYAVFNSLSDLNKRIFNSFKNYIQNVGIVFDNSKEEREIISNAVKLLSKENREYFENGCGGNDSRFAVYVMKNTELVNMKKTMRDLFSSSFFHGAHRCTTLIEKWKSEANKAELKPVTTPIEAVLDAEQIDQLTKAGTKKRKSSNAEENQGTKETCKSGKNGDSDISSRSGYS